MGEKNKLTLDENLDLISNLKRLANKTKSDKLDEVEGHTEHDADNVDIKDSARDDNSIKIEISTGDEIKIKEKTAHGIGSPLKKLAIGAGVILGGAAAAGAVVAGINAITNGKEADNYYGSISCNYNYCAPTAFNWCQQYSNLYQPIQQQPQPIQYTSGIPQQSWAAKFGPRGYNVLPTEHYNQLPDGRVVAQDALTASIAQKYGFAPTGYVGGGGFGRY